LAFFTASSRVQDNKHHPTDVVAGAALGTAVAFGSYWLLHGLLKKTDYKVEYAETRSEEEGHEMSY
jgi:membrane-associated phospholipid phosphatase